MKITIKHFPDYGRKSPWFVTFQEDGKRVRKYFKTQAEAQAYAADARKYFRSGYNPAEIALALRMVAGTAYSLTNVVQAGLDHLRLTANGHLPAASSAAIPPLSPLTDFIP